MTETMEGPNDRAGRHAAARSERRKSVPAAKTPVRSGGLAVLGVLWALVLVALGLVALHDALTAAGVFDTPAWITVALDAAADLAPSVAMLVAATAIGLLGLLLAFLALRPRRTRGVAVGAEAGTFLRHRHLSRLIQSRVEAVDGVSSANVSSKPRQLRVRAVGVVGVDEAALRSRVEARVREEVAALERLPRLNVSVVGRSR